MALKEVRNEVFVSTDHFMNETGEAGSVVIYDSTSGVGASLDDVNAVVKLPDATNGSGETPAGILAGDVVNKDLTKTHLNQHKRETQIGGKVGIYMHGDQCVTNRIASGVTPAPGDKGYFTAEGLLTKTATNSTQVVVFLSAKDSDGYAKVRVHIG